MSEAIPSRLKVSREGMVLIKSFEGFRPRAVRDEDGRWIIGYGHTASARDGLTVGEQDAELLLQYDLLPVVKTLNETVATALNQHQFDALASFAVSIGIDRFLTSDVLRRLNEGQAGQAADALIGWPETTAPDARLRRRAAERALFVADPASPVMLADLLAAPLPPPPVEVPAAPPLRPDFSAAVATLLGEDMTKPEPGAVDAVPPAFGPDETLIASRLQRYSPYAAAIVGPLPGFPIADPTPPTDDDEPVAALAEAAPQAEPGFAAVAEIVTAEIQEATAPEPPVQFAAPARTWSVTVSEPVTPLVSAPPPTSPFPSLDPLVLTAPTEADFADTVRPTWSPDERSLPAGPPVEESVLFEDEPTLSVLRHEVEPERPRRFDWTDTGMYIVMGGLGLAACAFSAAAFRLAVEEPSPMGETVVAGWALALIGIICVGVSSWNLYVRWGKSD